MLKDEKSSRRRFLQSVGAGTIAVVNSTASDMPVSPGSQAAASRPSRTIHFPRLRLPVLHEADVVIVGGSVAGVAAALALAQAGRTAVLVEHRNYLGREIAAPLKPWIDLGTLAGAKVPEPFAACLTKMAAEPRTGEMPLWMDGFKVSLEDLLLKAGVILVYASLPTQAILAGGSIRGVVIGNKSGRQVLRGRAVLDCSSTAVAARVAGGEFEAPKPADFRFVRMMEFTAVQPLQGGAIAVPEALGVAGGKLTVHEGHRGAGHVLLECPMELALGGMDLDGMMRREIEARRRTMRVASHLIQNHPAFSKAQLAICAYELDGLQTPRLKGPVPAWASGLKGRELTFQDKRQRAVRAPLETLAGPVQGLWCLNEAARVDTATRDTLRDPVNAALAGAAIAGVLLSQLQTGDSAAADEAAYTIPETMPHGLEAQAPETPQRGRLYPRVAVPASDVQVFREADVLVVGGGTSGATCAASAGREGARTVVLELCPGLGGTATLGGVSAYWYGRYWTGFCRRNAVLVDEVHKTINFPPHVDKLNGRWNIESKMYALLNDALAAGVEPFFQTTAFAAVMEDNVVRGAVAATPYGPVAVLSKMTADTTGDGDIAAFAGAPNFYGAPRDHYPMWYNLAQFIEPGRSRWHFMHTVDISNVDDYTRGVLIGRRRGPACYDHGCYIATRESRHIIGDVTLTLTDILRHRQFPDVVNFGAGQMDCHRRVASDWLRIGMLLPILPTEMPYRALLPRGLDNILVAGKAFSGAHDALYSLRNQPELENLGGAVGVALAYAVRDGVTARKVDLAKVQKRLTEVGTLLPEMLTRRIEEKPYDEAGLREMIAQLDGRHFSAWDDVQMAKEGQPGFRRKIPIVEICSADPKLAVPLLEQEIDGASEDRRLRLAQALAMFGSRKGVPVLIEAIERSLAKWQPPPAPRGESDSGSSGGTRGVPTPPADLVYSLGMTRDPRALRIWDKVAGMIDTDPEDFAWELPYPFNFTDSICYGAELLGDPAAIPILRKIHSLPKLNGQSVKKGLMVNPEFEKRSLTEVTVARGLASLGAPDGYETLIEYLDDNRANFAEFAHMTLEEFTGRNYGKDSRAWGQWLVSARESLKPIPLLERKAAFARPRGPRHQLA